MLTKILCFLISLLVETYEGREKHIIAHHFLAYNLPSNPQAERQTSTTWLSAESESILRFL